MVPVLLAIVNVNVLECVCVFWMQAIEKAKEIISGLGDTKVLVEVFEAAGHSKVRSLWSG